MTFNSVQLFGMILLCGLAAGELSRRVLALPRTTGYVVFGLAVGQSGTGWIAPYDIDSARLFIDLALGLILFELGYQVPPVTIRDGWSRLFAGVMIATVSGLAITMTFLIVGFPFASAVFAAALCLATSPPITIATCSDVGAKGDKTGLLFTMVAINGCAAFIAVALSMPFLVASEPVRGLVGAWEATQEIAAAVALGAFCVGIVLVAAPRLGRRAEHQHLLILGTIILGVGTAIYLDISVLLPMLLFGYMTRAFDHNKQVVAIRIASDARIFLVITFVLAGAALDIGILMEYWAEAVWVVMARFVGQMIAVFWNRQRLGLSVESSTYLAIGLQPMSSIALLLLANVQTLYAGLDPRLTGTLLATILLMQLLGPLATQTAIKGFGEATRLQLDRPAREKPRAA